MLNRQPFAFSSPDCNSISVKSGCLRICSRIQSCTSSVTRLTGPRRHGGRSICPVRLCLADIFLAQPKLTLYCSANSSSVSSPSSYVCRNFRLKSFDYVAAITIVVAENRLS
jgi:hypothetical protein